MKVQLIMEFEAREYDDPAYIARELYVLERAIKALDLEKIRVVEKGINDEKNNS